MVNKIKNIIIGWYYKLFNKEENLKNKRFPICNSCKYITNTSIGQTCNLCGCILDAKTRVEDEHCEIDKW